MASTIQKLFYL